MNQQPLTHTHNKSFKWFGIFSFLTIIFFLNSCEQSELRPKNEALSQPTGIENVEVVKGELHFTDPETYSNDLKTILAMDEKELDQWEESIGFKSYRSWFNQSADEFFEINSDREHQQWLEKYKDILYIQNKTVTPILSDGIYDRIINRSGEFMVGKYYYKVLTDRMITVEDNRRELVNKALQMKESSDEEGIWVLPFSTKDTTLGLRNSQYCGNTELSSNHQKGSDRKVFLQLKLGKVGGVDPQIGQYYETVINMSASGQKKGWFGEWNKYKTTIYVEDVTVSVNNNHGTEVLAVQNGQAYKNDVRDLEVTYHVGDKTSISSYNEANTSIVWGKGRSKTRGTGNEWTTICCNIPYWDCPDPLD